MSAQEFDRREAHGLRVQFAEVFGGWRMQRAEDLNAAKEQQLEAQAVTDARIMGVLGGVADMKGMRVEEGACDVQ